MSKKPEVWTHFELVETLKAYHESVRRLIKADEAMWTPLSEADFRKAAKAMNAAMDDLKRTYTEAEGK
jgi:hypothetical protein